MDNRIEDTLNYIEDNLSSSLKLDELSEVACLSKSQFNRLFKQETQRTAFKFIEEKKMAKAYELIVGGHIMVHELAFHLGYGDYETLSRAFKKHYFVSPDDLKSMVNRVREDFNQDDEFLILTVENDDKETILKKLKAVMDEKGLSMDLLHHSKAIKISEKTYTTPADQLIKNKYELSKGSKIWQSLIVNKNKD